MHPKDMEWRFQQLYKTVGALEGLAKSMLNSMDDENQMLGEAWVILVKRLSEQIEDIEVELRKEE